MNFKQWLILSESSFFKINDEQKKAVLDIAQKLNNLKGADFAMTAYQYGNKEIGIIPYDYPDSTDSAKDFDDFIIPDLGIDIDRRLKVIIDFYPYIIIFHFSMCSSLRILNIRSLFLVRSPC